VKLFAFILLIPFLNSTSLSEMRNLFEKISYQEVHVLKLKEISTSAQNQIAGNVKLAYYASAVMTSAKYKFNPASKLSLFNEGKGLLEKAIAADTSSVETRYIRFVLQSNVPSILNYNKQIISDKKYILSNLGKIKTNDGELYLKITSYLLATKQIQQSELDKIK
jgi:hypothetical protein